MLSELRNEIQAICNADVYCATNHLSDWAQMMMIGEYGRTLVLAIDYATVTSDVEAHVMPDTPAISSVSQRRLKRISMLVRSLTLLALNMPDQLPPETKLSRLHRLL